MAWDLDKLCELARHEQFAEQVRALARDLIVADPDLAEHLTPLCFYGPDVAGTLVRLGPHLRVDVRRLPDGDLCAQLVYVQQALATRWSKETDDGGLLPVRVPVPLRSAALHARRG